MHDTTHEYDLFIIRFEYDKLITYSGYLLQVNIDVNEHECRMKRWTVECINVIRLVRPVLLLGISLSALRYFHYGLC